MTRLTLNNGAEYDAHWISAAQTLTIAVSGTHTAKELADVFGIPENVAHITEAGDPPRIHDGYENLTVVNLASAPQGYATIILTKTED